jgi:hypothetical protein
MGHTFILLIAASVILFYPTQVDCARADQDSAKATLSAKLTFLDTLNSGIELTLAPVAAVGSRSVSAPETPPPGQRTSQTVDVYRIQCFASSSIEAARLEKKSIESRLAYPAYISFEQPFYRLQLGDFTTRPEAEKALLELRKAGMADAWIVRARNNPAP